MLKIRNFLKYRKCVSCGKEFLAYSAIKINKDEFICSECSRGNSYCTKNFLFTGKERDISFSFEFETSSNSKSLFELRKYNFIGCSDGSITGLEWKSRAKRSQLKRLSIKNENIVSSINRKNYILV